MPSPKRIRSNRDFQNPLGVIKMFGIPSSVHQINSRLLKLGYAALPYRNMQMSAQLAKAGLLNDNLVQWYQAAHGVTTGATGTVSQWLNLAPSRLALNKNLTQATAASQPTLLAHGGGAGNNYGYVNGVAGNYFTTPDSNVLDVVGDIDLRAQMSIPSWSAPAATINFLTKDDNSTNRSYSLRVTGTTGLLTLIWWPTGAGGSQIVVSSSIAPSFLPGQTGWIRATLDVDNGAGGYLVTFYTSIDGVNWSQLGTSTTGGSTTSLFAGTRLLEIGGNSALNQYLNGSIYRAQIYAGLTGTDLRFDFNPATYVSGTTFIDSSVNAATITLNGGATVNTFSSLYFDGVDDYLKTGGFTLNQPTTIYLVAKQAAWSDTKRFFDGITLNAGSVYNQTSSPGIAFRAPTGSTTTNNFLLNTAGILSVVFNSANSSLRVNRLSALAANVGTNAMGGFTLGASGNNDTWSNIVVSEILIFNTAHNTAQQDIVIGYLNQKYNLGL